MSRFLATHAAAIDPYVPGEQPRDGQYIKLNTNECPYPPSPAVTEALRGYETGRLRRYPDPQSTDLLEALAEYNRVAPRQVFAGNGSDEVLAFAFFAFFDRGDPVCYPDVTYGFYKVYAQLCGLEPRTIPLDGHLRVPPQALRGLPGHLFLANPNAPTGLVLSRDEIEGVLRANPDRLVVVDEAYIDYAGQSVSAAPLIDRYDNLLVVRTLSKSHALAGLRVGYALGCEALIAGLERIKYSFNSYNLDSMAVAAATAAVRDVVYLQQTLARVCATRDRATARLRELGLVLDNSSANFLFAGKPGADGKQLYEALRARGILVRYFAGARTGDRVRITVGADAEMDRLFEALEEIK